MKTYTEEQVDCLLAEIENQLDAERYEGDDVQIYESEKYVTDIILRILSEVKREKDFIIKRKLP